MIALIILCALILLVLLILFVPINLHLSYKEEFRLKIKFFGVKVFEFPSKKKTTKTKEKENEQNNFSNAAKGLFGFLKETYGFSTAVKKVLKLFYDMLAHIKILLRHIKVKNIRLLIVVSGDDAASTAIEYGKVCSAAYPVIAFLDCFRGIDFKKIDIVSDFEENKKEFEFSLNVKIQVLYMLISAYKIYSDYKNFTLKENYNERK